MVKVVAFDIQVQKVNRQKCFWLLSGNGFDDQSNMSNHKCKDLDLLADNMKVWASLLHRKHGVDVPIGDLLPQTKIRNVHF